MPLESQPDGKLVCIDGDDGLGGLLETWFLPEKLSRIAAPVVRQTLGRVLEHAAVMR